MHCYLQKDGLMKKQPKRFDMYRKPNKCKWWLHLVELIASPFMMLANNAHVKVDKDVKKLKGPFMILSTHASFMDFPMVIKGLGLKKTGWIMSVEEFRRGDWLMYGIGGMPKRKFTHDVVTVRHLLNYLKKQKQICTFYPEARFEFAGINEKLDTGLGKLCKKAGVPVVMCMTNGNFINSPQWSKHPYRRIRQEAHMYQLLSVEEIQSMSADEIQQKIEKAFEKDEYKWQVENNLHVKCKKRADGLYRILYKCPACGKEFRMKSEGTELWCEECGARWEMDTLSRLSGVNTDKGFSHIPDWYRWEREEVKKEVESGTYSFSDEVRVEDYYSTKVGLVPVCDAKLVHDKHGIRVESVDGAFELKKSVASMYSIHVEYDFLKKGDCFDASDEKTTYFIFLKTAYNYLTKLHFAVEELYKYYIEGGHSLTEAGNEYQPITQE